jgi:hypothetical protein
MFDPTIRSNRGPTSLSRPRRPLIVAKPAWRAGEQRRRRPLSSKPEAVRQRKTRRRRRVGLALFKLYLPYERLARVVRVREGLLPDAPVSRRAIRKNLAAGIEWWMTPWLNLNKQRHE